MASSVLQQGTRIVGRIQGSGDLEIHGFVEGDVDIEGELVVGEEARSKSTLRAPRVVVRGAVAGDVQATDSIVLEAGARVVGDLAAPRVGIRPGALVRGRISTDGSGEEAGDRRSAARPAARTQNDARTARDVVQAPRAPVTSAPVRPAPAPQQKKPGAPAPVVPALRKGAKGSFKQRRGS